MKRKFLHKLFSSTRVVFVAAAISVLPSLGFISYVHAITLPAFPGAEGWGAVSVGGRGGKVIEVTTLADGVPAPAGSLRACVEASGPRTCVFRVGGTIELKAGTRLEISNPYLTIAGQTAPGGGILVAGDSGIRIQTHDVIIRYLRVRLRGIGDPGGGQVYIRIRNGAYNVIVDHCSGSWTLDAGISIYRENSPPSPDITNVTIQWCVIGEALTTHAHGMLISGHIRSDADPNLPSDAYLKVHEISVHHNFFVHNWDRNPTVSTAGTQVINNVVYNWGARVGVSVRKNTVDLINNYWKPGPRSKSLIYKHESTHITMGWVYPDPSIYISGNIVTGSFENPSADNWALIVKNPAAGLQGPLPLSYRRYTPLAQAPNPIAIQSATDAYNSVLADVGANARLDCQGNWVPNPDAVDQRLIADVKNGTGEGAPPASPQEAGGFPVIAAGTPCADTDKDGMPDEWETTHFATLSRGSSSDSSSDFDGDGYTDLEEFLNGSDPTSGVPPPPTTPPTTTSAETTDTTPPVISNIQPQGTLPASTKEVTIALQTNEPAECAISDSPGLIDQPNPKLFTITGGTSHSITLPEVEKGKSYTLYARCKDEAGNINSDDSIIQFSIAKSEKASPLSRLLPIAIIAVIGIGVIFFIVRRLTKKKDSIVRQGGVIEL